MSLTSPIRLAALLTLGLLSSVARADIIADWNAKADALAADNAVTPPMQARTLAILHVSMFEAVNAIERRYAPYRLRLDADPHTNAEAAAAIAGYEALVAQYPNARADLDATLAAALAAIPQ